ncbi:UDP-N-acetylglucosamine 2-epimerase [Anaerovibrio lipolyticus]|uniref:UDP-N-acetylglucosamine 2-epimerase n=1 Tax=Anaerovibrio lipolyticus TaxID=82374 RepID=UPI0025D2B66E|nr:UDP-N-acetylglucosamine 2-epimerase [Anaerovibrio lipolyticus]
MQKKKVMFISGTRADYGKMKPLIKALDQDDAFTVYIFVCGMHLSEMFGSTYEEIQKDGYENIYIAYGLSQTQNSSVNLGNTITCLSGYVENIKPDIIFVHGDRMDALAGAVVGGLHNIMVGHIEGGELSGTIDESIRHAISKFAHVHFVCTEEARSRLIQLGEEENRIFVIGSPDIDIMISGSLPSISEAKARYDIDFEHYGIMMYHPVTTEYDVIGKKVKTVVDAVIKSKRNYIVIYPNNDLGSEVILNEYKRFEGNEHFRLFPSLRFEYFLVLLKNADFMIGNSSAGIRETGIYGVPAIDIGTRQNGRYSASKNTNLQHVVEDTQEILDAIGCTEKYKTSSFIFGNGNSTEKFMDIVKNDNFWAMPIQKQFVDRDM